MLNIKKAISILLCFLFSLHCINNRDKSWSDRLDPEYVFYSLLSRSYYLAGGSICGLSGIAAHTSSYLLYPPEDLEKLSHLLFRASKNCFQHMLDSPSPWVRSKRGKWIPCFHASWDQNEYLLSQIPCKSPEDEALICFLERRWLAKTNGFFPLEIQVASPCFDFYFQVSPETKNSYARDPFTTTSLVYENRMDAWKKSLPLPHDYPLILTRPSPFENHTKILGEKILLDVSPHLPSSGDALDWLIAWKNLRIKLEEQCKNSGISKDNLLVAQIETRDDLGGIRVLPWGENQENDYRFLLQWISTAGLTANPAELDRLMPVQKKQKTRDTSEKSTKESLQKNLLFESNDLMFQGMTRTLAHFLDYTHSNINLTQKAIVEMSYANIEKQLEKIRNEKLSFYQATDCIEEVYLNLTPLLEIYSPFTFDDFSKTYGEIISPPENLRSLSSYGLLASGMTSLTGIIQAVEKTIEKKPHIIYGENTYFEAVRLAEQNGVAYSEQQATPDLWEKGDLLIAQFNPVLKRDNPKNLKYCIENVASNIRKILHKQKRLTVALDATIDYLYSTRIQALLNEFQTEIEQGALNIVCFRSGIKFDVFGMDNYNGSPCFMIHNKDAHWNAFNTLFTDRALKTDRLSLQWFTLAFKSSSHLLDRYRKQIFDNTRALFERLPPSVFSKNARYKVTPVAKDVDPSFVDIKVSGPFHKIRARAIVLGSLYLDSMEAKHPMFWRRSFGFTHPNFGVISGDDSSTIRLTLGLDPSQVEVFAKTIRNLN